MSCGVRSATAILLRCCNTLGRLSVGAAKLRTGVALGAVVARRRAGVDRRAALLREQQVPAACAPPSTTSPRANSISPRSRLWPRAGHVRWPWPAPPASPRPVTSASSCHAGNSSPASARMVSMRQVPCGPPAGGIPPDAPAVRASRRADRLQSPARRCPARARQAAPGIPDAAPAGSAAHSTTPDARG